MLCDALSLLCSVTPRPCGACPCYAVRRLVLVLCDAASLWCLSLLCYVTPCLLSIADSTVLQTEPPSNRHTYVTPHRNALLRAVSKQPGSLHNTNNAGTLFHFKLIVSKTACLG